MAKKLDRDSQRIDFTEKNLTENIFEDDDYKRHIKETALQTGISEKAVQLVLNDFFLQMPKIIFGRRTVQKRISFIGFFHLDIKKRIQNFRKNESKQ